MLRAHQGRCDGVCLEGGLSRRGTLRTTHGTSRGVAVRTRMGQNAGAAGCWESNRARLA